MDLMCREDFTITARWGKQGENWDYVTDLKEEEMEALATANNKNGETVEYDWENMLYAGYPAYFYEKESAWGIPQNVHWYNRPIRLRTGEITGGYYAATQRVDEAYLNDPTKAYTLAEYLTDIAELIPDEVIGTITYPDADTAAEAALLSSELEGYVYEKLTAWFTGASDVEADWDAYLKELETIGLSRYLELSQEQWN